MKKTVIHIVGARPNFIKAAPIIKAMEKIDVENLILHTGQHYDENMSKIFFDDLDIPKPHFNLNAGGGSHAIQTADTANSRISGIKKYWLIFYLFT